MALPNNFTGSNNGVTQYKRGTYWKTSAEAIALRQWIQFDDETDTSGMYTYPGSPEGNVPANTGSVCSDTTNGGLYIKTTDTVATGWKLLEQDAQALETLTGNDLTVVSPVGNNINVLGAGSITTSGSGNNLTASLSGLTNHAVLVGAGTATITKVGPTATAGQVLQSAGAAADPAFSTATYPSTATSTGTILRADGTNWVATTATYPATTTINQILYSSANNTVTGLATANRGVLTTGATGVPVVTALATDGQLIIGSTAGVPSASTLTAGTGVSITNGSNSITIAVTSGGFTWSDASGAFSPLAENGYFITGTATGTLPAAPANGDTIKFFVDHASQVLTIQATVGKIIRFGSTVSAAAGTAVSTAQGDSVELVYRSTNTCWCAVAGFTGVWNVT